MTETVLRREITAISGSRLSLMTEGMEGAVSVEQMALFPFSIPHCSLGCVCNHAACPE